MQSNTESLNAPLMPDTALIQYVQSLTNEPGVYRMLDEHGVILYVGKAVQLKKRVSQYFQKNQTHPKTQALMRRVKSIEVTVTRTETEALLLESNLIKSHHPKYNILLRDDKSYPYLIIDTTHPFPSMNICRLKHKSKKNKLFGPFPNSSAVHETLNVLQKCFKIRNCRDTTFASRSRPCLQYQIKRCTAPCTDLISQEAYAMNVQAAIQFLSGKSQALIETLTRKMEEASLHLDFEEAARVRDLMQQLRLIQQTQSIVQGEDDIDVIAIGLVHTKGIVCIEHVKIRKGNVLDNQAYFPRLPFQDETMNLKEQWQAIFDAFMRFYYLEQPEHIPRYILTQDHLESSYIKTYETVLRQLKNHPCQIQTHLRGSAKGWMDFALNNLQLHLRQHFMQEDHFYAQIQALVENLKIPFPIKRLACFDVSHTQGQATVASCVVFTARGPEKSAYRQFTILSSKPGDDCAALREALMRYYTKQERETLPEVLLIDGGKGQVHVAQEVLKQLHLEHICLLGITKGEGRKACYDRIYDAKLSQFHPFEPEDKALHFLQYLRNEAHRFAIQAHRKKRAKAQLHSSLESIEGIGAVRRKKLLQYFGGLQALMKASVHDISQVPGMNPTLATRIFNHFH